MTSWSRWDTSGLALAGDAFRDVPYPMIRLRVQGNGRVRLTAVGHSLQLLIPAQGTPRQKGGLIANFNAITFDFVVRQKLGGVNVSCFIVKQLPVLPPETCTPVLLDQIVPRELELVYTAWDLAPFARDLGYEGDPFLWDEERRALLRAELDGIYAHLYGLNRDDFAYILEQFPIVKRKDQAAFGEYRTARLCLEAYDRFVADFRSARFSVAEPSEHVHAMSTL